MFNVGDAVLYRNGGNPRPATIIEVGEGGCPYRLNGANGNNDNNSSEYDSGYNQTRNIEVC